MSEHDYVVGSKVGLGDIADAIDRLTGILAAHGLLAYGLSYPDAEETEIEERAVKLLEAEVRRASGT